MPHQIRIRLHPLCAVLFLALLASDGFSFAQSASPVIGSSTQYSIALLPPNQMAADDRAVAEAWQQTIAGSAQFYGYTLDPSYTYREIACPVTPNHLILAYEATAANGSISRFTAVVRRGAEGEIAGKHASAQIIPILHAGVVPFVQAIANPHSIEVFNTAISPAPDTTEALVAAQKGSEPLLVRSLCYLAMVGEEPAALRSPAAYQATGQVTDQATIHAPVPTLAFAKRGQMRQMISIRSSANDYQVWALNFVSGGKLLSASRAEHPIDRTPLVLNADAAATQPPPAAAPISIEPASGTVSGVSAASTPAVPTSAPAPVAASAPVASVPAPAPAVSIPSTPTLPPPTPPAPPAPVVAESPRPPVAPAPAPAPTPTSAEATADTPSVAQPVTAPVTAPPATNIQPIALQPPIAVAPIAPSADATVPSVPATVPAAPTPTVAAVSAPPAVKPPLPPPHLRLFTNLPPPPSKFIPDSALKTPPHLPQ